MSARLALVDLIQPPVVDPVRLLATTGCAEMQVDLVSEVGYVRFTNHLDKLHSFG